jgi:hypothetical protein
MRQTDPDYIDIEEARRIIGGTKPVHRATIYRNVALGRISPPDHPLPGISRFRRQVLLADLAAGKATAPRKGGR